MLEQQREKKKTFSYFFVAVSSLICVGMSGCAASALCRTLFLQGELLPLIFTISPTASWRILLTLICVSQPTCSGLITVRPVLINIQV